MQVGFKDTEIQIRFHRTTRARARKLNWLFSQLLSLSLHLFVQLKNQKGLNSLLIDLNVQICTEIEH